MSLSSSSSTLLCRPDAHAFPESSRMLLQAAFDPAIAQPTTSTSTVQFRPLHSGAPPADHEYACAIPPNSVHRFEMIIVHQRRQVNNFVIDLIINNALIDSWASRLYHSSYGSGRSVNTTRGVESLTITDREYILSRWSDTGALIETKHRKLPPGTLRKE
jgi:hypothetical protein